LVDAIRKRTILADGWNGKDYYENERSPPETAS
jgi:hypothetical protein